MDRKLFAGGKIRRFRKGLGLTQVGMASDLGVSASYLNLMERDQRPVSARVLLMLAETFDLDLRGFAADADQHLVAALREAASDPVLEGFDLSAMELSDLAVDQPRLAEAVVRLHTAYRETSAEAVNLAQRIDGGGAIAAAGSDLPLEEVRDVLHARENHFPELEAAAEAFSQRVELVDGEIYSALKKHLRREHDVTVRILPFDVMEGVLRRYDRHGRRLLLSEMLEAPSRIFQTAFQIALFEYGDLLDQIVEAAKLSSTQAQRLLRVGLANYFAGAVMMPYAAFHDAAEAVRYDIDILSRRFSASFEQVCHRLTTLHRKGERGVPFFLVRVDQAGNVSKRFGGNVLQLARFGGACPRWNIYDAFNSPGRIVSQLVELPEAGRFLSIARTVRRPAPGPGAPGQMLAITVGCDAAHASRLAYADAIDVEESRAAVEIGVNCRLCERRECEQRAHPPLLKKLRVDETRRALSPFAFHTG